MKIENASERQKQNHLRLDLTSQSHDPPRSNRSVLVRRVRVAVLLVDLVLEHLEGKTRRVPRRVARFDGKTGRFETSLGSLFGTDYLLRDRAPGHVGSQEHTFAITLRPPATARSTGLI